MGGRAAQTPGRVAWVIVDLESLRNAHGDSQQPDGLGKELSYPTRSSSNSSSPGLPAAAR